VKYFLLLLVMLSFLSGCHINLTFKTSSIFVERNNTKIESKGILQVKTTKTIKTTFKSFFKTDIIKDPLSDIEVESTVEIGGSCVVVSFIDGWYYAATAKHVVMFGQKIFVDNNESEIVYKSDVADIALLKFKSNKRYFIHNMGEATLGDISWSIGFPADVIGKSRKFVVRGAICYIGKNEVWTNGGGHKGMSGGALLNSKNEVIGVISRFMYSYPYNTSFICCIPIKEIRQKIEIIKIRSKIRNFFKIKT